MSPKTKDAEEPKQTLAVGHPQAGYVSPDLSGSDQAGVLPDSEKAWNEARDSARDEEAQAVADHEDKVAKQEREEQLAEQEKTQKTAASAPASSTSSSGGSSSSSSGA